MNMRADVAGGPLMQGADRARNRFFSAYCPYARLLLALSAARRPA